MATPELELVLKPENSNFDENFGFVGIDSQYVLINMGTILVFVLIQFGLYLISIVLT